MINVGIVDDHALIISGLAHMLSEQKDCQLIFTAGTAQELMEALTQQVPHVLLLDIELPDVNGLDLCTLLQKQFPSIRIIALTNHDEVVYIKKMMRNGAQGYLLKGTDKNTLITAIKTVSQGQQFIDKQVEIAVVNQTISGKRTTVAVKLTSREQEILALIANEYSNQEIADKLFLSIRTVESHRHSLNQKLNVKTMAGLIKEAYLRGLI